MSKDVPMIENLWSIKLIQFIETHPKLLVLFTLCATLLLIQQLRIAILRRSLQRLQFDSPEVRQPPQIPHVLPIIGHIFSKAGSPRDYFSELAKTYSACSIFTLPMLGARNHVVVAPSLVQQVLNSQRVTPEVSFLAFVENVLGDRECLLRNMDQKVLWGTVSESSQDMTKPPFLVLANTNLAKNLSQQIGNLVTFQQVKPLERPWERDASTAIVESEHPAMTVSLCNLIRDFVGNLTIDTLLGPDFLANYTLTLNNLFTIDASYSRLQSNVPATYSSVVPATEAREKLLDALRVYSVACQKYAKGENPGPFWPETSKMSPIITSRIEAFSKAGDFDTSKKEDERGKLSAVGILYLLWAMNINLNPIVFWMCYYIYSNPELLVEVRKEVEAHVRYTDADTASHMDISALQTLCPLLKGVLYETLRLESASTVERYVYKDFNITENVEDAAKYGHEVPQTYVMKEGDYISVPSKAHQLNERYFHEPRSFQPRRFWVSEEEKPEDTSVKVHTATMQPWGGGIAMCPGRRLAEAQILMFVAAIVSHWDMMRVGTSGRDISWKPHPGHRQGTAAILPKNDVRVKIWKRI